MSWQACADRLFLSRRLTLAGQRVLMHFDLLHLKKDHPIGMILAAVCNGLWITQARN
ncbi:hypothetical protein SynBIOSE41_01253 [Synechococcus sp. BIOS-E4-1]|nr:hypothetical protein SynBIOSE41_01253 [Synechococcus sp. BIOS-E4-1]